MRTRKRTKTKVIIYVRALKGPTSHETRINYCTTGRSPRTPLWQRTVPERRDKSTNDRTRVRIGEFTSPSRAPRAFPSRKSNARLSNGCGIRTKGVRRDFRISTHLFVHMLWGRHPRRRTLRLVNRLLV